jgi:hypothetical protein
LLSSDIIFHKPELSYDFRLEDEKEMSMPPLSINTMPSTDIREHGDKATSILRH